MAKEIDIALRILLVMYTLVEEMPCCLYTLQGWNGSWLPSQVKVWSPWDWWFGSGVEGGCS